MKVSEKNSGTNMFRMKGGGKTRIAKKIAASGLAVLMVAESIFVNDLFGKDTSLVAMAAEGDGTHLETGLIGYYTFDNTLKNEAGSGSAALHGGAGGTWDSGPTGNTAYAEGKNGQAYSFTGDNGEIKGDGLELDIKTSESFTIGLWVNTYQKIDFQSIVFTNKDTDNYISVATNFNNYASGALIMKNGWSGNVWWLDKNSPTCSSSVKDIEIDKWTYVTLTMTKEGIASLYYDGSLLAKSDTAAGYFKDLPIYLGVNCWNNSFSGLMDDVVVYDRALSSEEVRMLYANNGVPEYVDYSAVVPQHVSVHDPSIVKDPKTGMYYVFGSHMAWAKSSDLIHWESFENNINRDYDTIFAESAKWSALGGSQGSESKKYEVRGNLWAPDVIWNPDITGKDGKKGKWCMYMSVNGDRWYTSVVLLTADSLEGDWTLEGTVVYSGFANSTQADMTDYEKVMGTNVVAERYTRTRNNNVRLYGMNAIDPCVLYDDDGTLWMAYGSWFGGIYMLKLDNKTGLRDYTRTYGNTDKTEIANQEDPYQGIKIAGGEGVSGEAPYIQKIGNSYYLFMSYGGLEAAKGYNMRIFKSDKLTGPYKDYSGDDARYTTEIINDKKVSDNINKDIGNRPMSGYQWNYMSTGYVAQGHNSAFVDDDGKSYVIYHTRFNDGTEGHQVRVHQMFVNEDGWLVTAPFEYTGETLPETAETKDVAGIYKVLFHKLNINYAGLEVVTDETLQFNEDGTVTGDRTGTWKFSETEGAPYVTMKIGDTTYNGVFLQQQKEDSVETTWCFTLLGSDEISVWGYQLDSEDIAQFVADSLIMPTKRISDVKLPTEFLNASITWKSANPEVLSAEGKVNRQDKDINVTLTAEITVGKATVTKDFVVTVCSPEVVYFNDFYDFAGTSGNATGWTSANASQDVSVVIDEEKYGYYLNFATDTSVNTRGIDTDFGLNGKVTKNYTVEADVKLTQSNNQDSCFAITGSDSAYSGNNMNNNITSGYILKLQAAANSDTYTVNDNSSLTVNIPSGKWTHITASVDGEGNVSANINGTIIKTKVNGSGTLKGIYYLRGRYTANMSIDNIQVKTGTPIKVGSMNGDVPNALGWNAYNEFFKLETSEDFTVNWKFRNYNPKSDIWCNYAIAVTTSKNDTWYLRADNWSNDTLDGSTVTYINNVTGDFNTILNGAWIDATLVRDGNTITFNASITATDGNTYSRKVKVGNVPLDDVTIYLGGQDCYLEISDYSVSSEHHYKEDRQEPTCTGAGKVSSTCIYCSEKHEETLKALGHNWDEGKVTKEASCDAEGEITYTCTREGCGETKTEPISTIPHTEGEPVKENEKDPTCTETGSYDKVVKCSVCGEVLERDTVEVAATGHKEGEAKRENVTEASCTTSGSYDEVIRCSVCGEILSTTTKEIKPLGHDWDEGTVTKEATCIEKGEKIYTCQREGCNETYSETIPLGKHTPSNEPTIIKPPTCTEEGLRTFECAVCHESGIMDPITPLGHDFQIVETIEPTCTETGKISYECSRCDEPSEKILEALGHTNADPVIENKIEATCETEGSYDEVVYCTVCEEVISRTKKEIKPLGHNINVDPVIENKIEATCETEGSYDEVIYCSVCKKEISKVKKKIEALGHINADPVIENKIEAECEKAGSYDEVIYCSVCGKEISRVKNEIEALEHNWIETEKTEATCTRDGEIVYTCTNCNKTRIDIIKAFGHTYSAPIFKWNSDDTATAKFICTICGEEHSVNADMTIQAANGVTTYTASVKGEDGKTYTSTKRIIALEPSPDLDSDMRIVVADTEEMEIPESLQEIEDLNTPEKITKKMEDEINEFLREQLVIEEGESADDFAFYDIKLEISKDNGEWETATEENFPEEGITITLPYPEGTNKDDYDFVVAHMLTIEKGKFGPGDIELPIVTKTDEGIQFTVTSLSPIAVSWTKLVKEEPTTPEPENPSEPENPTSEPESPTNPAEKPEDNSGLPNTADNSRIFLWLLICGVFGGGFMAQMFTRKTKR